MKRAFIIVLCLMGTVFPVSADQKDIVENLLKERTEAVLVILQENDLDEETKKNQIMDIVSPIIDFQLMAKLTLGKSHWGNFSEKQQAEFVDLFVKRLEKSYLDKSSMYCCVEVSYQPAVVQGNKIHVPIKVETSDKPLEMLYKFYSSDDGWKAYDVEVNGVSLIKSYQAQFTELLRSGTPEDLLEELKKTDAP